MKPKSLFAITVIACAAVLLMAAAGASAAEYTWKMPSIFADPSTAKVFNAGGLAQKMFCDLIKENSKGRIKVRPYYMSVLGGERELFEGLKRGDIECAFINPLGGADKRFDSWAIPYLARTPAEIDKVLCQPDSPLYPVVAGWLDEHKVKLLGIGEGGFRGCANKVRSIYHPQDISGLKIRVYQSPICFAFWKELAVATPLSWGEVYSALTMGTVDGLECPAAAMYAYKFHEGAKFFSFINWQWSSQMILMGKEVFGSLPDDLKKVVQETATEVAKFERDQNRKDAEDVVKKLEELGVKVNQLTEEQLTEFAVVAEKLAPEFKKVVGAEVYDQVMKAAKSVR